MTKTQYFSNMDNFEYSKNPTDINESSYSLPSEYSKESTNLSSTDFKSIEEIVNEGEAELTDFTSKNINFHKGVPIKPYTEQEELY